MSVLSLFKKPKPPGDGWHPASAAYPSLFDLAGHGAALEGKGGVYALWHLGVRPQWLRIGAGANLMDCLKAAAAAPPVAAYRICEPDLNRRCNIWWCRVKPYWTQRPPQLCFPCRLEQPRGEYRH
jgi:hypothetical protein